MNSNVTPHNAATIRKVEKLADRPGAPVSEANVPAVMIYREHVIALLRGEPVPARWFYGGKVPK